MRRVSGSAEAALDGMLIAAGGFGLCGTPELLLDAIRTAGAQDPAFASNNAGVDDFGIGILGEPTRPATSPFARPHTGARPAA